MLTRLISALILAPTAILAVILGGWWLVAFYGTAIVLAGYEFYSMARRAQFRPLWVAGLAFIAALVVNAELRTTLGYDFQPLLLAGAVAAQPLWELTRREHDGFLASWGLMVLGVVYLGVLGSYVFLIRQMQLGAPLLILTLAATWLTDIFAYLTGRAFGRTPFFPQISPKKTREGAIGGIAAGTLALGIGGSYLGMHPALALLGGLGIALATTAGDLTESLVKRNVGVKDSGKLVAGHGGVFDRLDSMFLALTFAFFYYSLILGYK